MTYAFIQTEKHGNTITGFFINMETGQPTLINNTLIQVTDASLLAKGNFQVISGAKARPIIQQHAPQLLPATALPQPKKPVKSEYKEKYKYAVEGTVKMIGEDVIGSRRMKWHEYMQMSLAQWEEAGVADDLVIKNILWERPDLDAERAKGKTPGHIYVQYISWRAFPPRPATNGVESRKVYLAFVNDFKKVFADTRTARGAINGISKMKDEWLNRKGITSFGISRQMEFRKKIEGPNYYDLYMVMTKPFMKKLNRMDDVSDISEAIAIDIPSDDNYAWLLKNVFTGKSSKHSDVTKALDDYKRSWAEQHQSFEEKRWKFKEETITNKLAKDFNFRAIQLGNYVAIDDKAAFLIAGAAYGAFHDLANTIMIPNDYISLGGRLAISFGARGSGNALATYDWDQVIINLTKNAGNGCVAHEYGHFIDNYMYKANQATGRGIDAILKVLSVDSPSIGFGSHYRLHEMVNEWNALIITILYSPFVQRSARYGAYWKKKHELFARAFEAYIDDKVPNSPYLIRHNKDRVGIELACSVYPQGDERLKINAAFDAFFMAMKEKWQTIFPTA